VGRPTCCFKQPSAQNTRQQFIPVAILLWRISQTMSFVKLQSFSYSHTSRRRWASCQSVVTGCELDDRGSIIGSGRQILLATPMSRPTLGPPCLLSNGYRGKVVGPEADHSSSSRAKVKKAWSITSSLHTRLNGVVIISGGQNESHI
jgi:hypothetical protein